MQHEELTKKIISCAFKIHNTFSRNTISKLFGRTRFGYWPVDKFWKFSKSKTKIQNIKKIL